MSRVKIPESNALKTDLYELTMAAGYFHNKVDVRATFELSCHTMPPNRSYLVACGLEPIIDYILNLRFNDDDIRFLKTLPVFQKPPKGFFDYLRRFRFSGDVWAMPEGEIYFAREPVIQVEAPVIEAQILETYLLSVMNIESLVATKAARIVKAACADGRVRGVVDFGSRRAHGPQAGTWAARASYIGGCLGTSNVLAGKTFGVPLYGTIAHSWVETFDSEEEAFQKYYKTFPGNTILLVDTYDTLNAVQKIVKLEWKDALRGVRLDSGDLLVLSRRVRKILDDAGLKNTRILASGNLNEYKVADLVRAKAPIDIFGVGTDMATSRDYPALDLTYKLVQAMTRDNGIKLKAKHSPQKQTIPGKKQVFRKYTDGGFIERDIIGLFSEKPPAETRPLLKPIIRGGKIIHPLPKIEEIRTMTQRKLAGLTPSFFSLSGDRRRAFEVKYTASIVKLRKMC